MEEAERYYYSYTGDQIGAARVDAALQSQWAAHYMIYRLFIDEPLLRVPTLDVGCGSGAGTNLLAVSTGLLALGVDNSDEAIRYATRHNTHRLVSYETVDVTAAAGLARIEEQVAQRGIKQAFLIECVEHLPFDASAALIDSLLAAGVRRIRLSTPFERGFEPSANEHHITPFTPERFQEVADRWRAHTYRYLRFVEVPAVKALIDSGRTESEILSAYSTDDPEVAGSYLISIDA